MTAAIYPGSFDPVTFGHLDVIERGAKLFDRIVVAVATNDSKQPVFTAAERVDLLKRSIAERLPDVENVEIAAFKGLIVDFAKERKIGVLLRGVRTVTDFEYELQMAYTNRDLLPGIETLFVMPNLEYSYVSSRLIRESVRLGADVSHLIPAFVQDALRKRLAAPGRKSAAKRGGKKRR